MCVYLSQSIEGHISKAEVAPRRNFIQVSEREALPEFPARCPAAQFGFKTTASTLNLNLQPVAGLLYRFQACQSYIHESQFLKTSISLGRLGGSVG